MLKLIWCPKGCNILTGVCTISLKPIGQAISQILHIIWCPAILNCISCLLSHLSISQTLFCVLKIFFCKFTKPSQFLHFSMILCSHLAWDIILSRHSFSKKVMECYTGKYCLNSISITLKNWLLQDPEARGHNTKCTFTDMSCMWMPPIEDLFPPHICCIWIGLKCEMSI